MNTYLASWIGLTVGILVYGMLLRPLFDEPMSAWEIFTACYWGGASLLMHWYFHGRRSVSADER